MHKQDVLNASHMLMHLIPTITQLDKYPDYPYFTDENIEAQGHKLLLRGNGIQSQRRLVAGSRPATESPWHFVPG